MKRLFIIMTAAVFLLSACEKPNQHAYRENDLGKSRAVEFGTILNVRDIDVIGNNSGTGAGVGALAGLGAGSNIGNGSGNAWATIGGALVGAAAGHMIEQGVRDSKGHEYTVELLSGEIKTIAEETTKGNQVFQPGDKVMLQYCDAGNKYVKRCPADSVYQRLIPVSKFPSSAYTKHKKKKRKVIVEQEE